ncbi:hypothetical protein B0H17DRAFT_1336460 [Mycena rosella]|uniref:Uncharacterized protein n=1 Tax=Mycena rosella TaxID=1033263 RepID=A0AAD7CVE2_MYCRO|nr:hypothetical protein B0H17DRAFT_1336460 [Mycena rosella]
MTLVKLAFKPAWLFIGPCSISVAVPFVAYWMWSLVSPWNPHCIQACARALYALLLGIIALHRKTRTLLGRLGAWLTALVSEYEPALLLLPFVVVVMGLYEVVVRAPALVYALHRA